MSKFPNFRLILGFRLIKNAPPFSRFGNKRGAILNNWIFKSQNRPKLDHFSAAGEIFGRLRRPNASPFFYPLSSPTLSPSRPVPPPRTPLPDPIPPVPPSPHIVVFSTFSIFTIKIGLKNFTIKIFTFFFYDSLKKITNP